MKNETENKTKQELLNELEKLKQNSKLFSYLGLSCGIAAMFSASLFRPFAIFLLFLELICVIISEKYLDRATAFSKKHNLGRVE